tara:strand:- start:2212 stop:4425 length:2214 start_codon:yes stop_codon:yes gene_type:complete
MNLYKELEKETGQGCGIFQPGSLYLAQTEDREHQLRLQASKAKLYKMNFHEVSRNEAEKLHPFVNFEGVRCIMWEPDGGNVDPSGVTNAYAMGARLNGAEIYRFTPVIGTEQNSDGTWNINTEKGDIHTEWVVNAAGLWGREVGRMANINLPLQPTEHQYFVTDTINEIKNFKNRLPSIADRDGEYYLRQEGKGLLIGAYEKNYKFWAERETPQDFGHDLFDDDLERIEENVLRAIDRVPIAGSAGIKRVINGPMIWSPDSNVLFGPIPEIKNYFCCNGVIPGFSQSGGMGLMAAEWIIKGETKYDLFGWDVARYGDWANKKFVKERVGDQYANRFKIHFPNEERSAGRPLKTRPAYDYQKELGAVFGLNYGWEHPLYFDKKCTETSGFTRQDWWHSVGREAKMLRRYVGVIDISNFAKYSCKGPGAEKWLNLVFANKMPVEVGRSCLTPLISVFGGVAGDATVTKISDDEFWVVSSGISERYQKRFYNSVKLPRNTSFESRTNEMCGFNIAGPKSRKILQRLSNQDLSNNNWPFMRSGNLSIAGVTCLALRISFTGDLGWEIYCKANDQITVYNALIQEAFNENGGPVGSRALMSLRIEKSYGSWGREYSPEVWPHECGLDMLCKVDKEFLNKKNFLKNLENKPRERLVLIHLNEDDCNSSNADATGGEPIFKNGKGLGRITSGAYGYSVGMSLALGYVKDVGPGDTVDVMVLGKPHRGKILGSPPFDAEGKILRA